MMEVDHEYSRQIRHRQAMARRQRNRAQLDLFADYCKRNPGLRFWQALYAITGAHEIKLDFGHGPIDPFEWEGLIGFDPDGEPTADGDDAPVDSVGR